MGTFLIAVVAVALVLLPFSSGIRGWWSRAHWSSRVSAVVAWLAIGGGAVFAGILLNQVADKAEDERYRQELEEKVRRQVAPIEERRPSATATQQRMTLGDALVEWDVFDRLPEAEQTTARARQAFDKAAEAAKSLPSEERIAFAEANAAKARSRLKSIDDRLSTPERITLAMAALRAPGDARLGVCRAKEFVHFLGPTERATPDVAGLLRAIKAAETKAVANDRRIQKWTRGLLCNDGTIEPANNLCSCDVRRGICCRYHDGVKGCEPITPIPDELQCDEPANPFAGR